jgi:hypothetical protein
MKKPIFITYYKLDDETYKTYDYQTDEYETINKLPTEYNKFELLAKKFKANEEGLKLYAQALVSANLEISQSKVLPFKYDLFDSVNHNKQTKENIAHYYKTSATMPLSFFKRMVPKKNNWDMLEDVLPEEMLLSDSCFNSGIFYATKDIEIINCFSYDFAMYYPRLLCHEKFYFPIKPGSYKDFLELNQTNFKNIAYGYYNCKITVKNSNCKKVFMHSADNWYTHYDLIIACKLKKQYGDITIEPLGKAYIYEEDDLIQGFDIFGNWYGHLKMLKNKCPKNIIVKLLSSSLWGYLVQSNTFRLPELEAEKLDLTTTYDKKKGSHYIHEYVTGIKRNYYKLQDLERPLLKYNFRLKSFITGFARLEMVQTLFTDLHRVHRIVLDGFLLDGEFTTAKKYKTLVKEDDKCGHVTVHNVKKVIFHDHPII